MQNTSAISLQVSLSPHRTCGWHGQGTIGFWATKSLICLIWRTWLLLSERNNTLQTVSRPENSTITTGVGFSFPMWRLFWQKLQRRKRFWWHFHRWLQHLHNPFKLLPKGERKKMRKCFDAICGWLWNSVMETTITTKKPMHMGFALIRWRFYTNTGLFTVTQKSPKVSQGHVGQHRALDHRGWDSMIHLPSQWPDYRSLWWWVNSPFRS